MSRRIADLSAEELTALVRDSKLDDREVIQVLRSPFCTAQIAELVAASKQNLGTSAVRERLAGFPGFNFARAMSLLGSLPWVSLLNLAQTGTTPPVVRRQAERSLVLQIPTMTLGERVAMARRAHRALFPQLIAYGDDLVLTALLDNPRLIENDLVVLINTGKPSAEFLNDVARHRKWGSFQGVRRAIAECPHSPLPLALSALVQLPRSDQRKLAVKADLPDRVRTAAAALWAKGSQTRESGRTGAESTE